MIGWMIDRNYTFYVKDLVQFLRNEHEFIGCEGTVRRGLLKAGFKRKLVSSKSDGRDVMDINTDKEYIAMA